jgi:hypothetical protein
MKTVNTLVEKLYKEAKHRLVEKIGNHNSYKELLRQLIVQVIFLLFAFKNLINYNSIESNQTYGG